VIEQTKPSSASSLDSYIFAYTAVIHVDTYEEKITEHEDTAQQNAFPWKGKGIFQCISLP
jgi:hypothetical protein